MINNSATTATEQRVDQSEPNTPTNQRVNGNTEYPDGLAKIKSTKRMSQRIQRVTSEPIIE